VRQGLAWATRTGWALAGSGLPGDTSPENSVGAYAGWSCQ
jgi:hypothetical protein